jgi:hypothetical protein
LRLSSQCWSWHWRPTPFGHGYRGSGCQVRLASTSRLRRLGAIPWLPVGGALDIVLDRRDVAIWIYLEELGQLGVQDAFGGSRIDQPIELNRWPLPLTCKIDRAAARAASAQSMLADIGHQVADRVTGITAHCRPLRNIGRWVAGRHQIRVRRASVAGLASRRFAPAQQGSPRTRTLGEPFPFWFNQNSHSSPSIRHVPRPRGYFPVPLRAAR